MFFFFSSILTTFSQISTLILGLIILIILTSLVKKTLIEGKEALTEIRNKKK